MTDAIKLHLGCGRTHEEGWVNCDLYPAPNVDHAFDVQKDWPFAANSVSEIYASHLLEHLSDPLAFFREAWRVSRPNASMLLRLPYGGHRSAWYDLTHIRPWYAENFCFFQPGYSEAVHNPQGDTWTAFFGVHIVDLRMNKTFAPWLRRRWTRRFFLAWGAQLTDFVEELWVSMYALKTPAAVELYRQQRPANLVPCRHVIFRHELEARSLRPGERFDLVSLDEMSAQAGHQG